MTISVIIPTWKRTDFLDLALRGLARQTRRPDEVLVGVRCDDTETLEFLANCEYDGLNFRPVLVDKPGVIASMQAAVDVSSGDWVCLLDDDAEPLNDWIERIVGTFTENPHLGAVGGRDLLMYLSAEERDQSLSPTVGVITPMGKMYGDHHRGCGDLRRVDVLKGCNCAFRGELIRTTPFDGRLRGEGAQPHWELAVCLDCAAKGWALGYDPNIRVKHHVAPRHGPDQVHRGGFSPEGVYDLAYNSAFIVYSRLRGLQRLGALIRATLIGSRIVPGWVQWLRLKVQGAANAQVRWQAARHGRRDGIKAARAAAARPTTPTQDAH